MAEKTIKVRVMSGLKRNGLYFLPGVDIEIPEAEYAARREVEKVDKLMARLYLSLEEFAESQQAAKRATEVRNGVGNRAHDAIKQGMVKSEQAARESWALAADQQAKEAAQTARLAKQRVSSGA